MSNEQEFILQPNSVFNISCTGKRNVVWAEPLPNNAFVYPGYYTATLFIYNATVENTGYYMCTYETQEGPLADEPGEDSEAGIYVFVPGEYVFHMVQQSWIYCVWTCKDRPGNYSRVATVVPSNK